MKLRYLLLIGIVVLIPGIAMGATVTQSFTYQGTLTNAGGTPLNGNYQVTFSLYEAASGGSSLATYGPVSVTVTRGQFTTPVTFDSSFFDGRALWLGIRVGADPEMTPRQELRPVPYALSLRPGAKIWGWSTDPLMEFLNSGGGTGVHAKGYYGGYFEANQPGSGPVGFVPSGIIISVPYDYNRGIDVQTGGADSYGVNIITIGERSPGVFIETAKTDSPAIHAITHGENSPGVFSETGKANSPAILASSSGSGTRGIVVSTNGANTAGISINANGDYSEGISVHTSGTDAKGLTVNSGSGTGIQVVSGGPGDLGIEVHAQGPALVGYSNEDSGVYGMGKQGGFFTTNEGGTGPDDQRAGIITSTGYEYNPGMKVTTYGKYSHGIQAETWDDFSPGFSAHTTGRDSYGIQIHTLESFGATIFTEGLDSPGVDIQTKAELSDGIRAYTDGNNAIGLKVHTIGTNSPGIFARSTKSVAVQAENEAAYTAAISGKANGYGSPGIYGWTTNGASPALVGRTEGTGSVGLHAQSVQSNAIWAQTDRADNKYGLQTPDIIRALNYETGASDVAEYMPVAGDITSGTVVVIGPDGRLRPSATAYDTGVAGIISTSPGISLGAEEDGNPGEALIAVAGRVPCRVDASNGPIHPRDLLTTSSNPGYAMKATDPQVGTVLGKAMGTLESGTGTIEVLVTLQ